MWFMCIWSYRPLIFIFPPSGSQLWVFHRDPWGAIVQQGKASQQRRSMGGWDSSKHTNRLPIQIDWLLYMYTAHKDLSLMKMIYLIVLLFTKEVKCSFTGISVSYIWAVKPCSIRVCRQKWENAQIMFLCLKVGWYCSLLYDIDFIMFSPCNLCTICDIVTLFSVEL